MMELTKLSLFSGIGGDDLASEWAGIETICFVEIDKFCQTVLKKHWPDVPIIGDIHDVTREKIKELTGREWVDIIAGGDPCQPRSIAGKRRGREDDRDLWPEMFRVICELKPTWVVNENPTGRLTMDLYEVLSELESQGYETRLFVIPACALNAPHRRDRLFIVAHSKQLRGRRGSDGDSQWGIGSLQTEKPDSNARDSAFRNRDKGQVGEVAQEQSHQPAGVDCDIESDVANSLPERLQGFIQSTWESGEKMRDEPTGRCYRAWRANWVEVATALCGVDDGLPYRVARLKALGNAVVPQQIYPIYKAIVEVEINMGINAQLKKDIPE